MLPVVIVVLLLLCASPGARVRLGLADAGTAPKDQTTRQAYDLLSTGFGPGFTEPIPVVIDMQSDHAARGEARDSAAKRARASPRSTSRSTTTRTTTIASVAIINTYGKYKPQDAKTDDLVSQLRHTVIPDALEGSPAHAYVSGSNAAFTDIGNRIFSHAPVVPALHHRHHVPGARDGVPLGGDRDQGRADDARSRRWSASVC